MVFYSFEPNADCTPFRLYIAWSPLKKNSLHAFLILFIYLQPSPSATGYFDKLYVWNVGQGLWVTVVASVECVHFDMGGERAPLHKILFLCARKKNILVLSHSDLDHIKFIGWGRRNLPHLCLLKTPREPLAGKKKYIIDGLPLCEKRLSKYLREIEFSLESKNVNDLSRVHEWHSSLNPILLPGDSTEQAERIWTNQVSTGHRLLVLGHHGSRTSTGEILLRHLSKLRMGVSSARKRRYGHPHPLVVDRLREHGVSTLRIEQWGNLIFDI
jgi:competence protein ComEC